MKTTKQKSKKKSALQQGAVMPSLWARFPKGVYAVDTNWNIKYHPTDVGLVMKAEDCRYIETDLKLIVEFVLAHNEA